MNQKMERLWIVFIYAVTLGFIGLLFLIKYPRFWIYIIPESSPVTWLETIFLALITFGSFLGFLMISEKKLTKNGCVWLLMAAGSFYLFVDEKFMIHERLRDKLLAPSGIKIPFLFWVDPGDFILLFILGIGIIFSFYVTQLFKINKGALLLYIIGVLLACGGILTDSVSLKGKPLFTQYLLQTLEEAFELFATVTFFNAVFLMLNYYIQQFKHQFGKYKNNR